MKTISFIKSIFKKFPFLLITNATLLLLANLIDALSVFSLVVVVDLFINPNLENLSPLTAKIILLMRKAGLPVSLWLILGVFMFFNILRIGFQIFAQRTILNTKYAFLRDMMLGTFEDFFNARWYFFSSEKQGMLLNTFIREMNVVGDAFSAMARYFSCFFQIILYLVVPFCISWLVTLICIVLASAFTMPFFMLGKISYKIGKINTLTANQISAVIQENLNLVKLILGFGKQNKSNMDLQKAFDAHIKATFKSQILSFSLPLMYYPFGLCVLIIGLFVTKKIALPLSETVVLFYALIRAIPTISNLTEEKSRLDNFFPSFEQVAQLRRRAKELKQTGGEIKFTNFKKEIVLKDVSFAYPSCEPVLESINMRIPKGKMVAIVGESGSGKSTLIDLIMGFNEPVSGHITFDGVKLQDFDINTYRHRIGYVPQDSVLFNTSIRDNLLWANEEATEEEINQACQQANAEEFIKKFPENYNTLVGDRGVRMSGGQIQRVALARAILRKPVLLILDEATSALDTYSERLIQQSIESIARETTVVVVAHRLSTIKNSDYIYVLKNGRIAEQGTYVELLKQNGNFNKMIQLQTLEIS